MFDKKNKKTEIKWIYGILLAAFLFKKIQGLFRKEEKILKSNFKDFLRAEKKEINEYVKDDEDLFEYCHDSYRILRDYFIPYAGNYHHPKILRIKSLAFITLLVFLVKALTVGYVFFVYPSGGKMAGQMEAEELALINASRQVAGESALSANDYLDRVALAKAKDMLEKGYFAHKTPSGKMPWDLVDEKNYAYLYLGENLAMNFTTADAAHKALMLSPTHKKNIINSQYVDIGLAVVSGKLNGEETNIMVQIFGTEKPQIDFARNIESKTAGTTPISEEIVLTAPVVAQKDSAAAAGKSSLALENRIEPQFASSSASALTRQDDSLRRQSEAGSIVENSVFASSAPVIAKQDEFAGPQAAANSALVLGNSSGYVPDNSLNISDQPIAYKNINESANDDVSFALRILRYSHYFFYFVLFFLFISLLINIFVRVTIRHRPAILQTLLSLAIIVLLIVTKVSFLERIVDSVTIL